MSKASQASVIVLCGAVKFRELIIHVAEEQTRAGHIVLAPFRTGPDPDLENSTKTAELDQLTQDRIIMADRMIVVTDSTGHFGYSAKHALAFALMRDMPFEIIEVNPNEPE